MVALLLLKYVRFWKVRGSARASNQELNSSSRSSEETGHRNVQLLTRALSESDSAPRGVSNFVYTDQLITCVDCGNQFTFTAGEQEFYEQKGFQNKPSRCPDCRQARKASRMGGGGGGGNRGYSSGPREMFKATCSACGGVAEVPFQPRGDKPVYCRDCFQKQRSAY